MSALTEIMHLTCFCLSREDGCSWQGLLLELEDHINDCEFAIQRKCPYHEFHCVFTGNVRNMEKHLEEDCVKHDSLLATSLKELLNSFEENRTILHNIKDKTSGIEKTLAETNKETSALQSMLDETAAVINGKDMKTTKLKEQMNKLEELIESSEKKKSTFVAFHDKFKELQKNVENRINFANHGEKKSSGNKEKSAVDTKKGLVDKVKRLGESNKAHETQLTDLSIKIRIFQCSSNDGRYIWKLDNLRNRFTEALSGKVDELYTPPLYTSAFGYKYSAKVMLYGTKDKVVNNNVKHLSFYIVIMQGDYDEILQFPFPYPISITLLNTSKKADITHTLYPDPNKVHFQKPYKNMNPAIGFSRFCSHDRLYSDGFVKNDAVYFKIIVDKTGVDVKEPNI